MDFCWWSSNFLATVNVFGQIHILSVEEGGVIVEGLFLAHVFGGGPS